MFIYILQNGSQIIFLQHVQQFTHEEFDALVDEYRYDYKDTEYQNEYDIHSVATDLEKEGFIQAPIVAFGR